jgi:hypothetical protein
MPSWSAGLVAYAAVQLSWHVNVVSYTSDSPTVEGQALGEAGRPSNMMYAEMAASIIAAAETEAAATDARLLPGAHQFVAAVAQALASAGGSSKLQQLLSDAETPASRYAGGFSNRVRHAVANIP